MIEQAFIDAINRALAKAPPLTPELRERVLGLLSSSMTGGPA